MPIRAFTPGLSLRLRPQVRLQSKSYTTVGAHIPHGHAHHAHHAQRVPYKKPSALRKWGIRLALAIAFPATYVLGAAFPPQLVLLIFPRFSPPPPHKDSVRGKAHTNDVEDCMQKLQLVENMRKEIQAGAEWYETRPYDKYDPQKVHNSLTAGTLRGPGKLAIPPVLFAKKDESEAVAVIHLGRALCGHDGIVHGGLLATVLDETLGRNALLNLPSRIGVTANLNINYRSPCMADQFVVVKTKLVELKGRKCTAEAKMETLNGEVVADAKALFIEPKWAQFLASSGVTEAMGRPLAQPENEPGLLDNDVEKIV
ncbi:hypothetical protein I312_103460 [Cryptococcus bacillisporus CA1280]|uniref:Mitochondrial protein n=2 Tax=Cryptococcus gattii TaxID=552467 RepID=A0A0D0UG69_CRYGA|nr:mitochondrial protein [Cryptococcus bacillisporus CA1280]KIR60452.1 mitochondrial protein [Cryptococcus bacillisporus CA1873]|eukprot:KIR60452.1 mitochondrial protein [Cryptococcus gattii CA1873]